MRFALFAGLASLVSSVTATALTYRLEANEKACFFNNVDQSNAKVAFYFAVGSIGYSSVLHLYQNIPNLRYIRGASRVNAADHVHCRYNLADPSMSTTP